MSSTDISTPEHTPLNRPGCGQGHVVQFYDKDEFLVEKVASFIGDALSAGDGAIVVGTRSHQELLSWELRKRAVNFNEALRQGRYLELDADETLAHIMREGSPNAEAFQAVVGGAISRVRKAESRPGSHLAIFGEMVALLWAQGKAQAAVALEQLWNEYAKLEPFSLHCAYRLQDFSREEHGDFLHQICQAHTTVIPAESYVALSDEQERLREVTQLQQKARVLESQRAETKELAKSLHQRETELFDFLENAVEGVQQVGADQKVIWANPALLKLLGYSADDYVNHRLVEFHADETRFEEFWRRLMRREEIRDFAAQMRCKDGSLKDVLINCNGVWEGGKFVRTRCFLRDVTEQNQMEAALRASKAELERVVEQRTAALRRLSVRILRLQDAERRRIARELHDSLGQYLTGLKIDLDMLRLQPGREQLWAQSEELLGRCISEVRTLSYLLHPPMIDESGLSSAARWYLEGFAERSGIQVTLETSEDLSRLPDSVELALFRILQEALTNVHRHSGASTAEIRILRDAEQVLLEIKDNGQGFPREVLKRFYETGTATGVGLSGMYERVRELGGSLNVQSDRNGTTLLITIPLALAEQ